MARTVVGGVGGRGSSRHLARLAVAGVFLAAVALARRSGENCVRLGRWDAQRGWSGIVCRGNWRRNTGAFDPAEGFFLFDEDGGDGRRLPRSPESLERAQPTSNEAVRRSRRTLLCRRTSPPHTSPAERSSAETFAPATAVPCDAEEGRSSPGDYTSDRIRECLAQPLIEAGAWERLNGDEFMLDRADADGPPGSGSSSGLLDRFVAACQRVVTTGAPSDWIDWQKHGTHGDLEDGSINLWVGRACRGGDYRGGHLPIVKSQSIVPLAPLELAELLLDSSRVQTYNKWSLGRTDVWIHDPFTKVVKNRTKPPVGSKPLVSVTLMHARPVPLLPTPTALAAVRKAGDARRTVDADSDGDGAWIVVSRAVGGTQFCDATDADCGRSDILLGINFLEPHGDDSSLVTAITHVHTSAVPTLLAEKLGLRGAVQFVKDLRALRPKVPA